MAPQIGQIHLARSGLASLARIALAAASTLAPLAPAAPKPKIESAPVVYEVATAGRDQKKLRLIFAAVNEANGGTLTKEEFLRRLKSREHFEIKFPARCRICNGWKRLIPDRGARGEDGRIDCKTCHGSGVELRKHIVKWKVGVITHLGDQRDPVLAALIRELGDDASPHAWFNTARSFHTGDRSDSENACAAAHAAYEQAIAKANAAWRHDEPASSDQNRLYRHIIDESLTGISATVPRRQEQEAKPQP